MSGSARADDPDGLAVPRQVCALLRAFARPWWVAGGWAVDLFLGRRTRPHKDIEIALYRHDQSALQEHLAGWNLRKVVDHRRVPWLPGEALTLPVHEIHGRGPDGQALEIPLNEHDRGRWVFRRDPVITRPAALVAGRSADGVPFLRPEIVLLYKSKDPRSDDQADFDQAAPLLDPESRAWLAAALQRHRSAEPSIIAAPVIQPRRISACHASAAASTGVPAGAAAPLPSLQRSRSSAARCFASSGGA